MDILCNVIDFKKWLIEYHNISEDIDLFKGYLFTFDTFARRLHNEIALNNSLQLTSNRILERADFHSEPLLALPNNCEKTILLKNIREKVDIVLETQNWEKLEYSLKQVKKEIVQPMLQLKIVSEVNTLYPISTIDDGIKYSTMNELLVFFNDTQRGLPHGYPTPMLDNSLWPSIDNAVTQEQRKHLQKIFEGYKYTVQYLWFYLLKNDFEKTSLKTIHKTNSWQTFNKYFGFVQNEIVDPIEKRLKVNLGITPTILISADAKDVLKPLFHKNASKYKPNELEKLEQIFQWYEIELVDSSEGVRFNGIPAVVSAITGAIEIKKRNKIKDKTQVVKLIHPDREDQRGNRNDYSYAILMEVYGTISDASGWLLFFGCCYDHTGTGLSQLEYVEKFLEEYSRKGLITVDELKISKTHFIDLMRPYLLSIPKKEKPTDNATLLTQTRKTANIQKQLHETFDKLGTGRGLLLELLTYFLFDTQDVISIDWNCKYDGIEIDALLLTNTELRFFECKKPNDNLIEEAEKFSKKVKNILDNPQFQKKWYNTKAKTSLTIVVWDRPAESVIKEIVSKHISIIIFKEELFKNRKFTGKKKDKFELFFNN